MKKIIALFLVLALALSLAACSANQTTGTVQNNQGQGATAAPENTETPAEEKVLHIGSTWLYASLNPHVSYQGWETYGYGLTETLFYVDDNAVLQGLLAESGSVSADGLTWTIVLRDGICFSDGDPLTAETVVANLQDLSKVGERYTYLADYTIQAVDEKTLTITTPAPNPILLNELADPDVAVVKLDSDLDNAPIGTGPFEVASFEPKVKVMLTKNANYWGGKVLLDGAEFTYIPDADTMMMALQNGEIDAYSGPTSDALEIFSADPDNYTVTFVPTTRCYFYYLNCKTLDANVRAAINMAVNPDEIVTMMEGMVEPTVGPFNSGCAYGKVAKAGYNPEAAKTKLEEGGYMINGDGYYEKNGKILTVSLWYYAARSIDKISALMQEQLKAVGILAELNCSEDADGTYLSTGDFDIGMYNMIAAPTGDPYYCLNALMGEDKHGNRNGYVNAEVQQLLGQLSTESDASVRADLANQIQQIALNDNAFGFIALLKKVTVMKKGVNNIGETNGTHGALTKDSAIG